MVSFLRRSLALSALTLLSVLPSVPRIVEAAQSPGPSRPQPAPIEPHRETLYGVTIDDPYRYMERMGPQTLEWMRRQGAYARALLDSIPARAALVERVADFTASFDVIEGYVSYGGRAFYEERTPGSDNFDLKIKDASGIRTLLDVAALRAQHSNRPYAINYFLASPDGNKVAVGVSAGGSEATDLTVEDAATGRQIAGPIDRTELGATSWSGDSNTLYFVRLKQLQPRESSRDKFMDATADAWNLTSEPVPIAGNGISAHARFEPDENPQVLIVPGATHAALLSINGVQNELKLWTAPVAQAARADASWTLLADRAAGITNVDMRGPEIFLLSHKNAPTFQVLSLAAGAPLSAATVLIPAQPSRVIEDIHAAADALYVLALQGAYSQLLRVPTGTTTVEQITLPQRGHIGHAFSDPRAAGISIDLSSWISPPTEYRYDPAARRFADLKLGARADLDAGSFVVSDLNAPSHDWTLVPLSLIQPKQSPAGPIAVLEAYGSYGISELADFSTRRAAFLKEGISYGICHVRGGGELGEAWRLGGKDANKHNTWEDLIACGQFVIDRGFTTPEKLFILGGSAGGITVGRPMTTRPDLFAGVIAAVPAVNTLRSEFSPNGPPNIPEFGSVTNEQGFSNLYAMDTIAHVKRGTVYPAVLISTGLNDPRVAPWEPAKLAAALQASGSPNPVLLRIDANAGHGIGSTKQQTDMLTSDWIAFTLWISRLPAWQPRLLQH